jgi:hypothetical protein
MELDPAVFGKAMGQLLKEQLAPIRERLDALEAAMNADIEASVEESKHAGHAIPYRGVWKADQAYSRGQFASHQGALWHCNQDGTGTRPGTNPRVWTLSVKSGGAR